MYSLQEHVWHPYLHHYVLLIAFSNNCNNLVDILPTLPRSPNSLTINFQDNHNLKSGFTHTFRTYSKIFFNLESSTRRFTQLKNFFKKFKAAICKNYSEITISYKGMDWRKKRYNISYTYSLLIKYSNCFDESLY